MNQQEATEFVIQELGKHHQKNDIIQKLCESTSMNWSQAEKFIQHVAVQHGATIAAKQSPLVVFIGVSTVLIGLGITILTIFQTLRGEIIVIRRFPIPYSGNVLLFLVGVTMITAGARGMWDTIARLWNS